jgi:hypothetical protein
MVCHKNTTHSKNETSSWKTLSLLAAPPNWLTARLAELRELSLDWDSYGGLLPTPRALNNAEPLVSELAREFGYTPGELTIPNEVFPNPDGGLELVWSAGDRVLGVAIRPDGNIRHLTKVGRGSDITYSKGQSPASALSVNHLLPAR